MAFILLRDRQRLVRTLLWVALASVACRLIAARFIGLNYAGDSTECNTTALALGCAAALIIWRAPEQIPKFLFHPWFALVSLIAIVASAQMSINAQVVWAITLSVPFSTVILLQAITFEWRVLENPIARYFGRISYGIYLWHLVGFAILEETGIDHYLGVLRPAAVVAVATLSYFAIERPLQSLGRAWLASVPAKAS
jgi:peptidoglycan/LPS O-acetylase OafA/YrhL